VQELNETLKNNMLFADLTDSELNAVTMKLQEINCRKGDIVYRKGDEGDAVYAVLEGSVRTIVMLPNGNEYPLAVFPAGSFVGDMDFLERIPRSTACKASEDSRLVSLSRNSFDILINARSEAAVKIMSRMLGVISERLTSAGLVACEMVRWGEDARKRAIADDLTGLFNLRSFDEFFPVCIARTKAEGQPLSFGMANIDHFIDLNKQYGEALGRKILTESSKIFMKFFQRKDFLFRYGSDKFVFLLPNTGSGTALKLCNSIAGEVRLIRFPEYPEAVVTLSIGIAAIPEHSENAAGLREAADKALYAAEEAGRDRAIIAKKPEGTADNPYKTEIGTIAEKNRIANRIIGEIFARDSFLLLGHKDPDADCGASLVAFAIILGKFGKNAAIFMPDPIIEQLDYLLAICEYNNITVIHDANTDFKGKYSAMVIIDTPNADMLMKNDSISEMLADPSIRKIELDHHLGANARYAGDRGYRLVSQASSTGELIGYLCLKMASRLNSKNINNAVDFFSRNLALAILTGIVGDSQMGRFLKSSRERWYYRIFSTIFERLLAQTTNVGSKNLASMLDIYNIVQNLSDQELDCYKEMEKNLQTSPSIHAVAVDGERSAELFSRYDNEIIVNVSRYAADRLSEESGKLGLSVYYDDPSLSDFVQFRLRRSASFTGFDLRTILSPLNIANGGGHPGAVGFRIPKNEIPDIHRYTGELLIQIERLIRGEEL
jgi:diguanylate cyclase (GGDEF)-like protein